MLAPGTTLGPYTVTGLLGVGGMGEVYRAHDARLEREVAIKVLPSELGDDEKALERFRREARAVAALSHPNILAIFDVGSADGVQYAVTELLEGETLRGRFGSKGRFAPREALEVMLQIAEGVAAAHARGIVHRDLKPENIFITESGLVKVLDFGLARGGTAPLPGGAYSPTEILPTEPGIVLGTMGYAAPEQLEARGVTRRPRRVSMILAAALLIAIAAAAAYVVHRGRNRQIDQGYDLRVSDIRGDAETRRLIELALRADAEGNRPKAAELLEEAWRHPAKTALPAAPSQSRRSTCGRTRGGCGSPRRTSSSASATARRRAASCSSSTCRSRTTAGSCSSSRTARPSATPTARSATCARRGSPIVRRCAATSRPGSRGAAASTCARRSSTTAPRRPRGTKV